MHYMYKNLSIFWSKGFIIGLLLLIVNDHYLKETYHNWFTGKLSDFAGLFIFPLFFVAWNGRFSRHIYWLTAILFIIWKSPLVDPLIEAFNQLEMLPISRVKDWTDLIALSILPISYLYQRSIQSNKVIWTPMPIILLASFSFIATSRSPGANAEFNKEYSFQISIDSLQKKVFFLPTITNNYNREAWLQLDSIEKDSTTHLPLHIKRRKKEMMDAYIKHPIYVELTDSLHICGNPMAKITVEQNREISKIKLWDIRYRHCQQMDGKDDKDILLEIFERQIIDAINE
jgi:hypothetical protein